MSLPSADTADLWMRKNIAEVTDPETSAKSYEADEAYMRTAATEAEITADFDAWDAKPPPLGSRPCPKRNQTRRRGALRHLRWR